MQAFIANDLRTRYAARTVSDMTSPYLVFCCTRETTTTSTPRNRAARPVGPSERTSETSISGALTGCAQSWCSGARLGVRDGRAVVRGVVHDLRRRLDVHAVSGAFVFKQSRSSSRSSRQGSTGRSRSHDAVIRVYDDAGNVIETRQHKGDFKEW